MRAGDLLVSWSATLGVFEWKGPDDALLNQHIFRVLPDRAKVEKAYLRHVLEKAIVDMQMHLHGATMQHVNRGEFLGTQIYLPPLPEQRRIAEVLDRAEALRARRRQALAHLDALAESIFLEMFGGFAYSQTKALADFCELITDGTHYTPTYADKGIVFLSAKNVTSGEVDWEQVK